MGILAILILPLLVVGISGVVYIYRKVTQLMTKSAVRSKVVVITDALSGVGKECTQVFHTGGARLILCGKHLDKLEALGDALNSVADPTATFTPKLILLDLADVNCIQDVAKEILDCYGCVDILINNASTKAKGTVQNVSLELDKKIMDANYFGPITLTKGRGKWYTISTTVFLNLGNLRMCGLQFPEFPSWQGLTSWGILKVEVHISSNCQAFLPNMISRRTGQIVLVNNIQGKLGVPFRAAYSASKHATLGFFDCLRAELQEFGVCVSTVSPSFICSDHNQPQPKNWEGASWKNFFRKSAYGVRPTEVAEEILRTVNRKKQEVFMANPIAKAAVYIRTFLPEIFFAVVAAGVKEKQKIEVEN